MRAVVYKEPFRVAVEDAPDPAIQHPNDAIIKITSSCICGSDLHMYAAAPGIVFGHENMGIIQEVGSAVQERKVGDRVVMPFNVASGFCKNCLGGFTGFCTTVNPGFAGEPVDTWRWDRGLAAKPNIYKCRTPTSTACRFLRERKTKRTSPCWPTYSQRVITARSWPECGPARALPFLERARLASWPSIAVC